MKYSKNVELPNNRIAELAILTILFNNSSLVKNTLPYLKKSAFFFESYKIIYEHINILTEENLVLNSMNIIIKLQEKNLLQKIGGTQTIHTITNQFENPSNLKSYIKEVNEKYLRRLIIKLGENCIEWSYTISENLENILDNIEKTVFFLREEKLAEKIYSVAEIAEEVFHDLTKKKTQETSGLKTSYTDLDAILQGFQKSDLIIIAGRPSMGKTAFSLNLAKNIVQNYKLPLIIFTLEMSRQQIISRFLSTTSLINTNRLRSGKMNEVEWITLKNSLKEISQLPIYIDDNSNLTLSDIHSKFRKIFNDKTKKGLVIIDYLQLMKLDFKLENRVQEISHITRSLKILAKEFEIPIILLSQLSRNVESRTNKRPMLSDLRESGCITKSYSLFSNSRNNKKEVNLKTASQSIQLYKNEKINSWNKAGLLNNHFLNFDFKGIKPTFLITFKNKVSICLTSNHKVLSKNGWVPISRLQEKDKIYCLIKKRNKQLVFGYNQVLTINYEGINSVYDKKITNFHNYLSQNIILHNSIEQDADIVILLYREEYYAEKGSDTHITEFIVAKHRNGQTGTAKLLFTPSLTSFSNINEV
jgi:replicative DNA helicase